MSGTNACVAPGPTNIFGRFGKELASLLPRQDWVRLRKTKAHRSDSQAATDEALFDIRCNRAVDQYARQAAQAHASSPGDAKEIEDSLEVDQEL
eukprot:3692326-Pyramimonas_sp.AAC.1